jgi:hypothetical protein
MLLGDKNIYNTYMYTCINMFIHSYIHSCTYLFIYICIYIHVYIHIYLKIRLSLYRVMQSWADAEWFLKKPDVPKKM